eukprot:TRINITY_DN10633_c0_g1_i2.p1 TRINITY_DN10633_c0_g1~~TRINITY_DN10633_c0_g1_i2.p1  ORF type:complete len:493 (-),score=112.27 TRINITY_DN10633_c0_g1_i2:207-1685(-)
MWRSLNTRVDEKHFGKRFLIEKVISTGQKYFYQIAGNGASYFVKGYQILLEYLKPGNADNAAKLMQAFKSIGEVYYEYCFHRLMSSFSPHFLNALEVDCALEVPSDNSDLSYLYIEILFEYGGESLYTPANFSIDTIYCLMKQSANAFSLLENMGIFFMDINPINMFYNKTTGQLKLLNVGSSFEYETRSFSLKRSLTVSKDIRQFTAEFAPPEVLQGNIQLDSIEGAIEVKNVDVYCWAMCFYSIILKKNQVKLKHEADYYKLKDKEHYERFMRSMKAAMESAPEESKEGDKSRLHSFITSELCNSLDYAPHKRPKLQELKARMQSFEKTQLLKLPYLAAEAEFKERLVRMLDIDEFKLLNMEEMICDLEEEKKSGRALSASLQEEPMQDLAGSSESKCKNCIEGKNEKAVLKCGHSVCKDCMMIHVVDKFSKGKSYKYQVLCATCNKKTIASKLKTSHSRFQPKMQLLMDACWQQTQDCSSIRLYFSFVL